MVTLIQTSRSNPRTPQYILKTRTASDAAILMGNVFRPQNPTTKGGGGGATPATASINPPTRTTNPKGPKTTLGAPRDGHQRRMNESYLLIKLHAAYVSNNHEHRFCYGNTNGPSMPTWSRMRGPAAARHRTNTHCNNYTHTHIRTTPRRVYHDMTSPANEPWVPQSPARACQLPFYALETMQQKLQGNCQF